MKPELFHRKRFGIKRLSSALAALRRYRPGSENTLSARADHGTGQQPETDDSAVYGAEALRLKREHRHKEALAKGSERGRPDWPPHYRDPTPGLRGAVPEIDARDFSTELMGGAVKHHGALLIRGLLSQAQVDDIRAMQSAIKRESEKAFPFDGLWYKPFEGNSRFEWELRHRTQNMGGNWLADSPKGLEGVLQHLRDAGVIDAIAEHLGETPAISLQKSTLRSVAPITSNAGWHQDGSFLGDDVRTMNIWVALSDCGGDNPASGLELIPHRFEEILDIDPALGRASLSPELVAQLSAEHSTITPTFAPGDAIMFDEKLLHRTAVGEHLSQTRYALESWFFAPSHTAPTYVPFLASELAVNESRY